MLLLCKFNRNVWPDIMKAGLLKTLMLMKEAAGFKLTVTKPPPVWPNEFLKCMHALLVVVVRDYRSFLMSGIKPTLLGF